MSHGALTHHRSILLLSLITLSLFLPFVGKPFHIDSPVTVYIARQILVNPLNPPAGDYGPLLTPWNSTELPVESAFRATPHPPLVSAWLAPVIKVFGEREWPVNLAFFPFYLGTVLYFYGLCGVFGVRSRFSAALLFAVSPVLFVNAQNVMYDVPLAMFSIGCLYYMFKGDTVRDALLCGLFAGCACLVKFTAGTLLIAGAVYFIARGRWKMLFWFVLPAGVCNLLWMIHNLHFFHTWQLTQNGHAVYILGDLRYRLERMVSYVGAGYLAAPFALYLWWMSNRLRAPGLVIGAGALGWSVLMMVFLKYSVTSALIYWLCAFAGGVLMLQTVWLLARASAGKESMVIISADSDSGVSRRSSILARLIPADPRFTALLINTVLQIVGGLFLTLYAVRYSLAFIFVFIFVSVMMADKVLHPGAAKRFWLAAIAVSLVLSIMLSISDYQIVNAEKRVAADLHSRYPGDRIFFQGRLGYLYYMNRIGAHSMTRPGTVPAMEDLVIKNCFYPNDDADAFARCDDRLLLIDSLQYPIFPFRTIGGRAGFYGNDRLPFAWVGKPAKRTFEIYRAVR